MTEVTDQTPWGSPPPETTEGSRQQVRGQGLNRLNPLLPSFETSLPARAMVWCAGDPYKSQLLIFQALCKPAIMENLVVLTYD